MNTHDMIEWLLDNGATEIFIGHTPDKRLFVKVQQGVNTGPVGNNAVLIHQQANGGLNDMLSKIKSDMIYCQGIATKVVILRQNS